MDSKTTLSASRNQYHYFGPDVPRWRFDGTVRDGLAAVRQEQAKRQTAMYLPLRSRNGESRIQRRSRVVTSDAISEFGSDWTSLSGKPHVWSASRLPHLYVELPGAVGADGLPDEEATRQIVIVRSIATQYRPSGLAVTLLFTTASHGLSDMVGDMEVERWMSRRRAEPALAC